MVTVHLVLQVNVCGTGCRKVLKMQHLKFVWQDNTCLPEGTTSTVLLNTNSVKLSWVITQASKVKGKGSNSSSF